MNDQKWLADNSRLDKIGFVFLFVFKTQWLILIQIIFYIAIIIKSTSTLKKS